MCRFVEIRYSYSRHICAVISMAWHVCTVIYGQWSSQQTGHGDHWCPAAVTELAADRVCAWTIVLCQRSFSIARTHLILPKDPKIVIYDKPWITDAYLIWLLLLLSLLLRSLIIHCCNSCFLTIYNGVMSACAQTLVQIFHLVTKCVHIQELITKKLFEASHSWNVVHLQCTVQKNSTMSIDFVGSQLFISFSLVHLCVCVCVFVSAQ